MKLKRGVKILPFNFQHACANYTFEHSWMQTPSEYLLKRCFLSACIVCLIALPWNIHTKRASSPQMHSPHDVNHVRRELKRKHWTLKVFVWFHVWMLTCEWFPVHMCSGSVRVVSFFFKACNSNRIYSVIHFKYFFAEKNSSKSFTQHQTALFFFTSSFRR